MSEKKLRIELNIQEDKDASGKFYTVVSSLTDKHSGTARVLNSASAADMKQAIFWCKQYTMKNALVAGRDLWFNIKDKPKKAEKVAKEPKVAPPPPPAASFSTEETFDQPNKTSAWN